MPVLDNDLEQLGAALDEDTLEIVELPQHQVPGSFRVNGDRVRYQPTPGYVGPDSFTYRICNDDGLCDTAVVTILVGTDVPPPDRCADFDEVTLAYSFEENLDRASGLNGVGFIGSTTEIYVFAMVPQSTTSVAFYFNDQQVVGPPVNVDATCAYQLEPLDTGGVPQPGVPLRAFGSGIHTMTIVVTAHDGGTTTHTAVFGVLTDDLRGGPGGRN